MKLTDAWLILGKDPDEIFSKISSGYSIPSRINIINDFLNHAKEISKKLLAQTHPDRNPNDSEAESRFKKIQQAIQSIEYHTNKFKEKAEKKMKDQILEETCYIQFK